MDSLLNFQKISTNTAFIFSLQNELDDLSASVVDLRPLIEDLSAEVQILETYTIDLSNNLEDLDITVQDLSATVLDISINVKTIQDDIINFAELHTENIFIANNTFTSTAQANLAPTVDTSIVNKLALDTAIAAIPAPDLTNYARLDISNTFTDVQTFLSTIQGENIVANALITDNYGQEIYFGEQSNTYWVNYGVTGTSGSITSTLGLINKAQGVQMNMTVGSYDESVMVAGKSNLAMSAPVQSGKSGMTELTTPQTLLITDCYRFRLSGLTIHGMTTINGAVLRHQFKNCNFNGGLTISSVAPLTEWITITDSEIAVSLDISSFGGVVYFYRCNFQNATFTLSPTYSSTQIVLFECQGIPVDIRDPSVLSFFPLGTSSYYDLSGNVQSSEIQSKIFLHTTTPTLDNQVTSKIYVDSEITSATTDVAFRSTDNVFTGNNTFNTSLSTTNNTPVGNQVVTKNYLDTQTALKADLASPVFSGNPSLPTNTSCITQIVGDNSTKLASTAFVLANAGGGGGGDAYLANAQTFTALNNFTGGLTSSVAPTSNLEVANKLFVDNENALKADLASPVFSGSPSLPTASTCITQIVGDNSTKLASTAFVLANAGGGGGGDAYLANAQTFTALNNFTGGLTSSVAPTSNLEVANKLFVDNETALKANIASPTFTGAPSLPTASTGITQIVGDNSTKLASTAFVLANGGGGDAYLANAQTFTALNNFTGGLTSSVAPTSNLEVANKLFVDNENALKANIASPAFTGSPSLPTASSCITQAVGNNTNALASTAFVLANAGGAEFVAFRANSVVDATINISAGNGEVTAPLDNTSLGGAFDTHGLWDNSTHRFTADRTGYWEITWKFYSTWTNLAYTANFSLRRIRSGVTTVLLLTGKVVMITTDMSGLFLLEENDQLYITQGGNAGLPYNYGQNASFFQGRFISA